MAVGEVENPDAGPEPRGGHDMVYHSKSDRSVLFGGFPGPGGAPTVFADTWAYNTNVNAWIDLAPEGGPPGRTSHAMEYDAQSDRVVLFGGVGVTDGAFVELNDTWAYDWDNNTWSDMNPPTAPSPRLGHRMAYDAGSDLIVLLGGHVGSGPSTAFLRNVWVYDLDANTWEDVTSEPLPAGANHHGMVYDVTSNRIVAFGGESAAGLHQETWIYETAAGTWTPTDPPSQPPPRWLHTMAYDEGSDRCIVFGGTGGSVGVSETWSYDLASDSWQDVSSEEGPSGRILSRMAYDRDSDLIVLFGGLGSLSGGPMGTTWTFDSQVNVWTLVGGAEPPPGPDLVLVGVLAAIGAGVAAVALILFIRRRRR